MHPAILNTLNKPPIIPRSLRPNVLAWWDARERGQVWYGLNQIVVGGNFPSTTGWSASGATISASSGKLSITGDGSLSSPKATQATNTAYENGKIIALKITFKVDNANCTSVNVRVTATGMTTQEPVLQANPTQNTTYTKVVLVTLAAGGSGNISISPTHYYADAATANGKVLEVQNVMAYALSDSMGAGNTPTATEMDAILTADGNQYWEGTRQVLCNPDYKYYWRDYSGNGRHMKLNNFAYSGASGWQQPYGLATDGVDDYGRYAATEIIPVNTSFSMMCIFAIPNITGSKYLLIGSGSSLLTTVLFYFNGTNLTLYAVDSVSGSITVATGVQANKKYFAVATYDQIDKKCRIFLNGNLFSTSDALTNGIVKTAMIKTGITSNEVSYSAETIYGLGLFSQKALSPSEVKQLYDNNRRRLGL